MRSDQTLRLQAMDVSFLLWAYHTIDAAACGRCHGYDAHAWNPRGCLGTDL